MHVDYYIAWQWLTWSVRIKDLCENTLFVSGLPEKGRFSRKPVGLSFMQ
jgi:hypothetical protein